MSLTPLARQLLAGLTGAAGGVIVTKYLTNQDATFEEYPATSSISKPFLPPRAAKILAFGQPAVIVPSPLVYKNHVLDYDSARRVPKWVAEHLSRDMVKQEIANRKGVNFSHDPVVPAQFRSTNQDYWGSGWSRGHMAPAGDNKHCQESMRDTFYLTNVVPQDLDNNGNYWNRLEIWVRGLTDTYQDVWVISGPLWLPKAIEEKVDAGVTGENEQSVENKIGGTNNSDSSTKKWRKVRPPRPPTKIVSYPVLGPNLVAVPTHLYKIVLVTDPSLSKPLLGTFIVPNIPVGDKHLSEFKVDLAEVERGTGVRFHPELDREEVGDLCVFSGCNLQDYREFQQFFWTRRLRSPWNLRGLEKDWAEAQRKGLNNAELENVYMESKTRLELKELENEQANLKVDDQTVVAPAA